MNAESIGSLVAAIGVFLFFGAIGLAVGQHKGRPKGGFWWGAFLGPLGWFVVALGPDLRAKCPECLGVIDPLAQRCPHCGVRFTE